MDQPGSVRVGVLGEIAVTRDGTTLPLGGRRQGAVLAALAMARGEAVPADRLIDCVWGARPPAHPGATLQSYVSHLRRRLQPQASARNRDGVIVSSGGGYALRLPADAVDAWRFEQAVTASPALPPDQAAHSLDAALGLWRGPAYADYADEPWTRAEITRLTELRQVARERLLGARLDLGDAALLVGDLEALVADDPLREERWRLLVLALYRAHRQADALAALRRARETLNDLLGIDPGPALRSLEREVLQQSASLDGAARTVPPAAPAPAAHRDKAPAELAEREHEMARLGRILADLESGRGGVLLIQGPAGIGKTALLRAAAQLAGERSQRVLSARSSRLEQAFGFGVVRQLFEPAMASAEDRQRLLSGAAATARGVFEDPADSVRADGAFMVLHGLHWLLANLSQDAPVLITVDDLQWCDSVSLRFIAYLSRRLDGLPVTIAATVRTGEAHPDAELVAELLLDPAAVVLTPQPLSVEATATLVADRLGEPVAPFVAVCHATTAGNPLLLRQLLRALESADVRPDVSHIDTVRAIGSRAVSSLVMLRLRHMPADAIAVARAVAVIGEHADLPTIAAFAGLAEPQVATMLELLVRAEILQDCHPPAFVHPLVRDAVYDDQPSGERALQHERAAQLLSRVGARGEHVAAHLLLAPRRGDPATVATLRAAARNAADRGATDSAATLLRRALEEPAQGRDRVDVLLQLGLVEALLDGPAALAHLSEAYAFLEDPAERAAIAMAITRAHLFASPPGVATGFAREAAAAVPDHLTDERQGLQALHRMTAHMHGLPPCSDVRPELAPTDAGAGCRMLAATLAYEQLLDGGNRDEAVRLARFALEDDHLLAADNGLLWVTAAVVIELADGDIGDFWDRAMTHALRVGSLFAVLSVNLWRGFTEWRRGRLDDALLSIHDSIDQGRMWGSSELSHAYAAAFAAGVQLDRGDVDGAERELQLTGAFAELGEGSRLLREAAARVHLARGRLEEALAAAIEPAGMTNPAWTAWRGLRSEALARLGRPAEALRLAEEDVALLRRWGAPTSLAAALRRRGTVLIDMPRMRDAGLADLRAAVELVSSTPATLGIARACLILGRQPEVDDDEATRLLKQAWKLARDAGALALQRVAAEALRDRGVHADAVCASSSRLTARHRQVRDLAALGLDAGAIAQRLFLPPGTVHAILGEAHAAASPTATDASHPQVVSTMLQRTPPWSPT